MLKKIKYLTFILLLGTQLLAQPSNLIFPDAEPENRRGKLCLLPELGASFGLYTHVEIISQLGYHLTDRISIGAGPHYIFYRDIDKYSTHIWGVKTFSRITLIRNAAEYLPFYLFDELFLHGEYEWMSLDKNYFIAPVNTEEGRFWKQYLYVGAGFSRRLGSNVASYIMVLWNLNESYNSLYNNPTYRLGITYYFR